jgi:3-oxoacyl-[acyl-carrier protein] reductase
MGLEGRVALVTGGSRGAGRGIALGLARDGADVAVNYRKDADAAEEVVAEIEGMGRRAIAVRADVDDYEQDKAMVEAVVEALGPVGILVNNAGIASRGQSVSDTDPDELRRVIGVHALGAHHVSALVLPGMRTLDRGDIVMISSIATRHYAANGAPYGMAKAALEALAFALAKEEVKNGIRVNVVAPGLIETEMGRRLVKAGGVDDIGTLHSLMPLGRVVQPEDVAGVVRYLVSEQAALVTGQRIYLDGGAQR